MTRRPKYVDYLASMEAAWDLLEPLFDEKHTLWREENAAELLEIGDRLSRLGSKFAAGLMVCGGISPRDVLDHLEGAVDHALHVAPRSRRSQ